MEGLVVEKKIDEILSTLKVVKFIVFEERLYYNNKECASLINEMISDLTELQKKIDIKKEIN